MRDKQKYYKCVFNPYNGKRGILEEKYDVIHRVYMENDSIDYIFNTNRTSFNIRNLDVNVITPGYIRNTSNISLIDPNTGQNVPKTALFKYPRHMWIHHKESNRLYLGEFHWNTYTVKPVINIDLYGNIRNNYKISYGLYNPKRSHTMRKKYKPLIDKLRFLRHIGMYEDYTISFENVNKLATLINDPNKYLTHPISILTYGMSMDELWEVTSVYRYRLADLHKQFKEKYLVYRNVYSTNYLLVAGL